MLIEDRYQQGIDAMTPAEKIHRMWTLSAWGREMLAGRIQAELSCLGRGDLCGWLNGVRWRF